MVKENLKENLLIKKIHKDAELPKYSLDSDVGLDLVAVEDVSFLPMEQKPVRTGLIIKIPEGHVGLIRDRSGIVTQMNIHTVAGTFDPAYRGEVSVVLVNFSDSEIEVEKGMKIAQLLIIPVTKVGVKEVKTLEKTKRGEKGFGSTGLRHRK
ncbi:MAG: dUTP diphosphatase [Candidatus Pacearchaeota archaeon]|jgi:dUTP pyrophosphatase